MYTTPPAVANNRFIIGMLMCWFDSSKNASNKKESRIEDRAEIERSIETNLTTTQFYCVSFMK